MSNPHEKFIRGETAAWQNSVTDKDLATPPGSPADDDRYIVGPSATGDWAGYENEIAWYNGTEWEFYAPVAGWRVDVLDESKEYRYNGSVWAEVAGGSGTHAFDLIVAADGTGDYTDIASALAALGANQFSIFVKPYATPYSIDATIVIPKDRVKIVGAGFGTELKLADNTNEHIIWADSKDGVSISGLRLDGNKANQTTGRGIDLLTCTDYLVEDCTIVDTKSEALVLETSGAMHSGRVSKCTIKNSGLEGFKIFKGDGVILTSIHIEGSQYNGLILDDCDDCIISSSRMTSNGVYGVNINNSTCDRTLLDSLNLYGNTSGGYNDSGSDTHIGDVIT